MVTGLGARAIVERLKQGLEPADQEFLVFATNYLGAPGDPDPLLPYDQVTVCGRDGSRIAFLARLGRVKHETGGVE